jgi:hypothetical protein
VQHELEILRLTEERMGVDDFLESEVGVAIAATAAVMSPRLRRGLRRGAVFAVAGALTAGELVANAARGAAHEAQARMPGGGEGDGDHGDGGQGDGGQGEQSDQEQPAHG